MEASVVVCFFRVELVMHDYDVCNAVTLILCAVYRALRGASDQFSASSIFLASFPLCFGFFCMLMPVSASRHACLCGTVCLSIAGERQNNTLTEAAPIHNREGHPELLHQPGSRREAGEKKRKRLCVELLVSPVLIPISSADPLWMTMLLHCFPSSWF